MARTKREGSTLSAVLRQAWDGNAPSVLNRSALTASSSHVAVVGHITPREFRIRLAESELAGGTYNRFLPLFVDRSKRLPLPEPVPRDIIESLGNKLSAAIEKARGGLDADEIWTEFIRRAAPYCLRIGALHAVTAGRNSISEGDLAAAAGLVRYSIASARYVLDRQARDPRLDRIRRAVIASPDGLTRSEISGLFSRNLPRGVLDELLAKLIAGSEFEVLQVHTSGRPATYYRYRDTKKEETTHGNDTEDRVVSSSFVDSTPDGAVPEVRPDGEMPVEVWHAMAPGYDH